MTTTTTMAKTIKNSITMPKPVMTSLNKKSNMGFETYLPRPAQRVRETSYMLALKSCLS